MFSADLITINNNTMKDFEEERKLITEIEAVFDLNKNEVDTLKTIKDIIEGRLEALNIASVDSRRELLPLCDRPDYKQGWADCLDVNDLDTAGNKRQ